MTPTTLPAPGPAVGTEEAVLFQAAPSLVQRFADLTGDHSALHVDPRFARRSLYRNTVIHGMLPLALLPCLGSCRREGQVATLRKLTGNFCRPAFPNDSLVLTSRIERVAPAQEEIDLDYAVLEQNSRAAVTTGRCTIRFTAAGDNAAASGVHSGNSPLVLDALVEQDQGFDRIPKGQKHAFRFAVSPSAQRGFRDLIALALPALDDGELTRRLEQFQSGNLLAALLFSTYVGMCAPGRQAAFLSFAVEFEESIQPSVAYRLAGEISFKSESTRTLTQNVVIAAAADAARPVATGKITAKVNALARAMPSSQELKESGTDLGLRDKVILITGASRGIGETAAKLLALHGAKVVVNYRHGREDAERVVAEIVASGGAARALQADVADREQVRRMVESACRELGAIDVLVNNAVGGFYPTAFLDLTWEDCQKDLDVILKGAFHCCQEVLPLMAAQGQGRIINLLTAATDAPPSLQAKYVMAKSGLLGLTRSLAVEFGPQNIQVNAVVPTMVDTDLTQHVPKFVRDGLANDSPLQRLASPLDVARAVLYLSSSLSSYITGQRIMVTGGMAPLL